MKVVNSTQKKWAVVINLVVLITGIASCLFLRVFGGTKEDLLSILCLFAGFQGAAIVVAVSLFIRIDKNWLFNVDGITEKNRIRKDKLIRYSDIQAIVIYSAVDRYFFPIRDKTGVQRSVIVIYDRWTVARNGVRPDSVFVLPATSLTGALSHSFFTGDALRTLMDKTNATVLVPQKMYVDNKDVLDNLFAEQKGRVFISALTNDAQGLFELRHYDDLQE